jgi:hypothetical protein
MIPEILFRQNLVIGPPIGLWLLGQLFGGSSNQGGPQAYLWTSPLFPGGSNGEFEQYLENRLNMDVSSVWVQNILKKLEYDVKDTCFITYGKMLYSCRELWFHRYDFFVYNGERLWEQ